jgi:hypothetical protein
MSQQLAQSLEIAIVALIFGIVVLYLSQKQAISFRYTVGWLMLCAIGMSTGFLIPVIGPLTSILQLDAFAFVGGAAIIVLLAICIQLSISISGLQRQLQRVNEEIALHKNIIEDIRDRKK